MGAGALAAYLALRWLQSPGRVAEMPDAHVAAYAQRHAGQPGMDMDAAGVDADLLHGLHACTSSSISRAALGPLGASESTMGSAAMLSTAEILQSVADQQASAGYALGESVSGSAAVGGQEMPGATIAEVPFSGAGKLRLGRPDFMGAASVREPSALGGLAALFRLSSRALWL